MKTIFLFLTSPIFAVIYILMRYCEELTKILSKVNDWYLDKLSDWDYTDIKIK